MKYDPFKISQLIVGFLTNRLNKEGKKSFDRWSQDKESNKDFLETFRKADDLKEDLEVFKAIDTPKDWINLKDRIDKSEKKVLYSFRKLAVAASLILFALGSLYYFKTDFAVGELAGNDESGVSNPQFSRPARSGAQLILADGSSVLLGEDMSAVKNSHRYKVLEDGIQYFDADAALASVGSNTLVVPKGEYYNITLPDGTKVWVNAMSKLKFPERFGDSERLVELEGEAFFDVAREEDRPFIVVSNKIHIKVLGTSFNVNSYNTNYIRTSLVTGSVMINSDKGDSQVLKPGERADFTKGVLSIKKADLKREMAWKNGEFFFREENIVNVMNEISRWYDIDVTFAGDIDFESSYSGNVGRHEPLPKVLEVLSFVGELSFSIKDNKIIVENKKKK